MIDNSNRMSAELLDRCDIAGTRRAEELTTEEFLSDVAESAVLSHAHKKLLNDFLKHADLVKFAGVKPSPNDIEETLNRASQFLDETKENAPMVLVENQQSSAEATLPREADRG